MRILINSQKQENIKAIQVNDYFVIVDLKAEINSKMISQNLTQYYKQNDCHYKIIASTKTINSKIPLIVFKEQSVEELAENYANEHLEIFDHCGIYYNDRQVIENAVLYGYNQAKSSNKKYTEEDILKIVKFVELYQTDGSKSLFSKKGTTPTEELNKFIESLNQPKLPDVFNLEIEKIKGIIIDGISEESIKNAINITVNKLKTTSTPNGEIIEITI